ncbi:FAD-binding oxidoreductase, partial [Geobacillus sp. MMMUD3]|nr:FAD-binding oxidoreductase [Geobacillus sp. MMMUD3]
AGFEAIAEANGATEIVVSDDPDDSDMLVAARRAVAPAMETYANTIGGGELIDDVCVPRSRLGEFFARLREIDDRHDVVVATAGHAGDGNMHPSVVFDARDEAMVAQAQEAFAEIMQLGLDLGGTITGEHGVGRLKKPWLADYLGADVMELNHRIKAALDPDNILNPGAVY